MIDEFDNSNKFNNSSIDLFLDRISKCIKKKVQIYIYKTIYLSKFNVKQFLLKILN